MRTLANAKNEISTSSTTYNHKNGSFNGGSMSISEVLAMQLGCGSAGVDMSRGQKQLLCLARALVSIYICCNNASYSPSSTSPLSSAPHPVILVDEASAALDEETHKKINSVLLHVSLQFHCTLLMVTHKLPQTVNEAENLCNYMLRMEEGRLVSFSPVTSTAMDSP